MTDITTLVESLADLIATKVAEKMGGNVTPSAPAATVVPPANDKSSKAKPPAKAKPAAEPEPEPAAEEPAAEEQPADDSDLVTDAQKEFVADTVAQAEIENIKSELLDYFVSQGNAKEEIASTLAGMSEEELRAAYTDYTARLVIEKDGGEMEFTSSFTDAYKASRVSGGETKLHWIKGGVTLDEETCKAEKLADPNKKAPAAPPAKRTALPGKAKK
jgi:hypothetical protein